MKIMLLWILLVCISGISAQITKLNNSLAGQRYVTRPASTRLVEKCDSKGKPLDLMLIVDSSGSVQADWPQVREVLKSIANYVAIFEDGSATRISMLIYANDVTKIFDFNTYYVREQMLEAIDNIQPINGVTKTGKALNASVQYWTEENGMRGLEVSKLLFLFSDGRANDFPLDTESAVVIRERYGIPIYVCGYGEQLDWKPLTHIVGGDSTHIVNSKNATDMFDWLEPWKEIKNCEFVVETTSANLVERCETKGKPLDMMLIVDSSGSVKDMWPQVRSVLKSVVHRVAIVSDGSATRVSMLIYANNVNKVFDFNTFYHREDMLAAIDNVRPINGVTKTGNALNRSLTYWNVQRGMRGPDVSKMLFLFTDGRASDFPKDTESARILREEHHLPIYVYGYGEYLDWNPLTDIVGGDSSHIVNSRNASKMFDWILPWKGIEICEMVPLCIPGANRPIDILFVIDTSSSVKEQFQESINFVESTLNIINVHPDAARVALIMYSTRPVVLFDFKAYKSTNEVNQRLVQLRAPTASGVTNTAEAVQLAIELFNSSYGARDSNDVKRLTIIVTDAQSSSSPQNETAELRESKNVDILAVRLKTDDIDYNLLFELVGEEHEDRIFVSGQNLFSLRSYIRKHYTDRRCVKDEFIDETAADAEELSDRTDRLLLRPIDTKCSPQGMVVTVRTRNPFDGAIFTLGHDDDVFCVERGHEQVETEIILKRDTCGVKIEEVKGGYKYIVQIGIRFHDLVYTDADEAQEVTCFVEQPDTISSLENDDYANTSNETELEDSEEDQIVQAKSVEEVICKYNIKDAHGTCKLLDSPVGNIMEHEWRCNLPSGHRFLVHDCSVHGDNVNAVPMYLLSNEGCETDAVLLGTPQYNPQQPNYLTQRAAVFRLQYSNTLRFKCLISICDMNSMNMCKYMFSRSSTQEPLACRSQGPLYYPTRLLNTPIDYHNPPQSNNFERVLSVSSRFLNVYDLPALTKKEDLSDEQLCSSLEYFLQF